MSDEAPSSSRGARRPGASGIRTDWPADYLDGRTATRRPATVRLMATGIEVHPEGGIPAFWRHSEIRQTQGFYAGEEVRLERGRGLAETLVVRDPDFLTSLAAIRGRGSGLHGPERRRLRLGLTVGAGVAVLGITAALYLWGIPLLAAIVAARVPVAWEERLGAAVVEQLAPAARRCDEGGRQRRIDEIVTRLTDALEPPSPYRLRVFVVRGATVNALAAPGGYIVVFQGLLDQTESAEELAGVLTHELQHIQQRHATKMLVQHTSTGLLLMALTGDVTGVMAYGLESARVLGQLQYSRLAEKEADREGMRLLLAAHVDPAGMLAFFERLEGKDRGPALLTYLSSHPSFEDRIARLTALAEGAPARARLLPDYDWRDIRSICPARAER
jgi:Zn-dependent protease with chaperone function